MTRSMAGAHVQLVFVEIPVSKVCEEISYAIESVPVLNV